MRRKVARARRELAKAIDKNASPQGDDDKYVDEIAEAFDQESQRMV